MLARIDEGEGYTRDLDLLIDICNQIEGNTICALGDAAAWPVRWGIRRFREEFEAKCRRGAFPSAGDGSAPLTTGSAPTLSTAQALLTPSVDTVPQIAPSGAPAA